VTTVTGIDAGGLGVEVSGLGAGGAVVGTWGWPSLFSVIVVIFDETGGADGAVVMLVIG